VGPLEARVKEGIPICSVCGKKILSTKRMSREFVLMPESKIEVIYRHKQGLCKPDYMYKEDR
jgi:hypothetical protein